MSKLKIYINKEVLNRFKEEGISLDYVGTIIAIIMCLYEENFELLDHIDDSNKSRRLLLLYRYLVRRGLLEEVDSEEDEVTSLYALTEKGMTIAKFLYSFDEEEIEIRKENIGEILEAEQKVEEWISDWINLFPEGKHFGRNLRTNPRDCSDRMKWFVKNYGYTKEQIFNATEQYLEAQRTCPEGYRYTRNSTYFICKGRGGMERVSDLSTECEKIKNEGYEKKEYIERDSA